MKKIFIGSLLAFSFYSWAVDTPPPIHASSKSVTDILLLARNAIKAANYEKAIELLTEVDQKKSADWNNLMGFSLRKKNSSQSY